MLFIPTKVETSLRLTMFIVTVIPWCCRQPGTRHFMHSETFDFNNSIYDQNRVKSRYLAQWYKINSPLPTLEIRFAHFVLFEKMYILEVSKDLCDPVIVTVTVCNKATRLPQIRDWRCGFAFQNKKTLLVSNLQK